MSGIAAYIAGLLSKEIYTFSREELREHVTEKDVPLGRELSRLAENKQIINLRKGFYLILPPMRGGQPMLSARWQGRVSSSSERSLPSIDRYADSLFRYLDRPYYAGLFTAARCHGAGYLPSQQECFVIQRPALLNIAKHGLNIHFYTTVQWPEKNLLPYVSADGSLLISSLALTMADLIHYQTKLGGADSISPVFGELSEGVEEKDMTDLLSWYPHKSILQRLGFWLEQNEANPTITDLLFDHLQQQPFYPVLLSPEKLQKAGAVDNRWKIDDTTKEN